jgi:serine/threonine protein kinase
MVDVLGTRLGRYEIRERLGKGGMAAVYKAWDTNLERWVAVKVLHEHLADEADFKTRFEREAKVVASLNHPNIVQVYDFDVIERNGAPVYYMVMAYIPGRSLKSIMDEKHGMGERLPLAEIDKIMREVCGALSYAHGQGMVHRDVTPGNILFNEQGQAVLADFGIARMVSGARLTQTGMTSGTPLYMPPEQGIGAGGDHRSDIYSLGVILYEMLVGEAPYNGDSAVAIIMKHINEPVPSPLDKNMDVSPAMEAVVLRALSKDPEDRYPSVLEMLADYERARSSVRSTMVEDEARTVVLPAAAPARRTLPWAWLAGGLVAVVLILAAAYTLRASSAGSPGVPTAAPGNPSTSIVQPTRTRAFASSMANGPLIFKETFGPDRNDLFWPTTTDDPQIYRNIEDNAYHIWLKMPTTALPSIFDDGERQYGPQYEYDADLTISEKSQPDSGAGLIFRYRDDDNYYVYGINGLGQISIWSRAKGVWTELRNLPEQWTPAEGAKPAGQTNHLKLVDHGKNVRGYVNGQLAFDVIEDEPAALVGGIGIYVATTSSTRVTDPLAEVTVSSFTTAYSLLPTVTKATMPATQDAGAQ